MKKNENIIIVCNTVYQIMVAVQLRHYFFQVDKVDIVVSNHMSNSLTIAENIRKTHYFDKFIYIKNKKYILKENCRFYS